VIFKFYSHYGFSIGLNNGFLPPQWFWCYAQGFGNKAVKILRLGGVANINPSSILGVEAGGQPLLGGQQCPDAVPTHVAILLMQIPLNTFDNVVSQYSNKHMCPNSIIPLMVIGFVRVCTKLT